MKKKHAGGRPPATGPPRLPKNLSFTAAFYAKMVKAAEKAGLGARGVSVYIEQNLKL